ncbi:hypothetical protein R6Q57_007041 [Mikania cordata]
MLPETRVFSNVAQGIDRCSILEANNPHSSKWLQMYQITITHENVPNVVVACDDRGGEVLNPGYFTSWKFRMNFWLSNSYSCRFYWFEGVDVRKFSAFSVFDKDVKKLCENPYYDHRCYWYLTKEGFYFSNNNASFSGDDWNMMHEWNNL